MVGTAPITDSREGEISVGLNRGKLQVLTRLRLKEARVLLNAGQYPGSYYLAGYAVECALKACIARKTRRYDFPNKGIANKAWSHRLEELVKLAELWPDLEADMKTNKTLEENWATVKDWSESERYNADISLALARDYYSACTARNNGIISWIKRKW